MARLINDTGILGDTVVEVSTMTKQGNFDEVVSFDLVVEAIHQVQSEMGITGTTAQEAFGTIEGSISSLKAAWSNWLVGLGDENADLSGLTDNLIGSFETAAGNVIPVIGRIGESLTQVFSDLTGIDVTPVVSVFTQIGDALSGAKEAFADGGVTGAITSLVESFGAATGIDVSALVGGVQGISDALSGAKEAFADGGVTGAITSLIESFGAATGIDVSALVGGVQGISDALSGAKEAFADGGVTGAITSLIESFGAATGIDVSGLVGGVQGISDALSGAKEAFADGGVTGAITSLIESFGAATGIDVSGLLSGVQGFFDAFDGIGSDAMETISGAVERLLNAFANINVAEVITAVGDGLGKVFEVVGEAADLAIDSVAEVIHGLVRDFEIWAPLVTAVAAGIGIFVAGLNAMSIIQTVQAWVQNFGGAFAALNAIMNANPILLVVSAVGALATAFITAYQTNEDFRNGCVEAWKAIQKGATELADAIVALFTVTIPNAISSALSTIKSKAAEFAQAGRDLINGIKDGITEKVSDVTGAIGDFASGLVSKVTSLWDEHSPSRVFRKIGEYAMDGLSLGFEDGFKNAERTLTDSIYRLTPDGLVMHGKVDFANSAIGKASAASINSMISSASQTGGGAINVNLNVDGRTLAQVVFDPLNGLIKQKGVTLGA